jgi:formylglycine-generating enzyme required for sulfatase activity
VISVGVNSCEKKSTREVCAKAAGDTEQGLCDMTGNASEWMEDWYQDSYRGAPNDGSAQESPGSRRAIRGASWAMDIAFAPAVVRGDAAPETRSAAIGFRPARSGKSTIVP